MTDGTIQSDDAVDVVPPGIGSPPEFTANHELFRMSTLSSSGADDESRSPDVGIVGGAGHIGLPLAIVLADRGHRVRIQTVYCQPAHTNILACRRCLILGSQQVRVCSKIQCSCPRSATIGFHSDTMPC